jgi:3D (Asp-Asp-Asp) domain-containing protein
MELLERGKAKQIRRLKLLLWAQVFVTGIVACVFIATLQEKNEKIYQLSEANSKHLYRIVELQDVLAVAFAYPVTFDTRFDALDVAATAYSATEEECDDTPWITANGTPSTVGRIATSPDLQMLGLRPGTTVAVAGMGLTRIDDSTSSQVGKGTAQARPLRRTIDVLMAHKQAAKLYGRQRVTVIWPVDTGRL